MPYNYDQAMSNPLTHIGLSLMQSGNPGQAMQQGTESAMKYKTHFDKQKAQDALKTYYKEIASKPGGATPEELQAGIASYLDAGGDVSDLANIQKALMGESFTLSEGQKRFNAQGQVVAEGAPKKTEFERTLDAAGIPEEQRPGLFGRLISKRTTHAPGATVNIKEESEEGKAVGKYFGETYANLQESGISASNNIVRAKRLDSLLDQVDTGKFKGTTLEIKKTAKALGVDLDAVGVADDVAPAEASRALINQMALELRNPAGGAGMPGALSDKDRDFLVNMVPGLETTREGRKMMVETYVKLQKRQQDVAKLARDYRNKNGRMDDGFYEELAVYSEQNPLFDSGGSSVSSGNLQMSPIPGQQKRLKFNPATGSLE